MLALTKIFFWLTLGFVLLLSQLPVDQLPKIVFDWWDKAQHALAFFALSVLGFCAYQHRWVRVLIGLLAYGALIEVLQWLTGWRHGEFLDWLADGVGISIALIAYFFYHQLFNKKQSI